MLWKTMGANFPFEEHGAESKIKITHHWARGTKHVYPCITLTTPQKYVYGDLPNKAINHVLRLK